MSALAAASEKNDWQLPEPCHKPEDLGRAMPKSAHAASVCMPLWEHNVAYEEGDQSVISAFSGGYPRFFMNPLVAELRLRLAGRIGVSPDDSLLLPSEASALRCAGYVQHRTGSSADIRATEQGVWLVHSPPGRTALREFWQHSGEIVSSRTAQLCISGAAQSITATDAKRGLRERVAELQHVSADDVYLFPCGMSAIYAAWRITASETVAPIQFGFPYVDTFKILERFGAVEPWFYPKGSTAEIEEIAGRLKTSPASALFCEVPGNPLLATPDIPKLSELARVYDFPLIVDDTLGAMLNVDVRPYADLIATSLTKFFSGQGDVLAGSLCLVPDSPNYQQLKEKLDAEYEDLFCDADADALLANSVDVRQRVTAINKSTQALVEALRDHPVVDTVHYPSENAGHFESVRDSQYATGGYGGLLSVVPKNAEQNAPRVYDALQVCKGPNLGTNFTLCCPYTILAHYEELDFASDCGVSPYLIRISVGLEPTDWIIDRVMSALDAAAE